MNRINVFLAFVFCCFLVACQTNRTIETETNPDWILKKHLQAIGELKRIQSIETFYTRSSDKASIYESYIEVGKGVRIEGEYDGQTLISICTDSFQISCSADQVIQLPEVVGNAIFEDRHILQLYEASARGWHLQLGPFDQPLQCYHLVGINERLGERKQYWINQETFLLEKIKSNLGYEIEFFDYKNYDGLLYPSIYATTLEGERKFMKILEIKINPEFEETIFDPEHTCTELANADTRM